jgi:hypothetical protein
MTQVGFETTIPVFQRAKTVDALDRAATVIGIKILLLPEFEPRPSSPLPVAIPTDLSRLIGKIIVLCFQTVDGKTNGSGLNGIKHPNSVSS